MTTAVLFPTRHKSSLASSSSSSFSPQTRVYANSSRCWEAIKHEQQYELHMGAVKKEHTEEIAIQVAACVKNKRLLFSSLFFFLPLPLTCLFLLLISPLFFLPRSHFFSLLIVLAPSSSRSSSTVSCGRCFFSLQPLRQPQHCFSFILLLGCKLVHTCHWHRWNDDTIRRKLLCLTNFTRKIIESLPMQLFSFLFLLSSSYAYFCITPWVVKCYYVPHERE